MHDSEPERITDAQFTAMRPGAVATVSTGASDRGTANQQVLAADVLRDL